LIPSSCNFKKFILNTITTSALALLTYCGGILVLTFYCWSVFDPFPAVTNPFMQAFFIPRPHITLDMPGEFVLEVGIGVGL